MTKEKALKKLEIKYIHKDKLCLLEGNPRKIIDPKSSDKLKTLIKEHGFQNPLQVFKEKTNSYSILCGNHRYAAGCELGMKEFPCIVYEGSRNKALARAISDNKSNLWTEFDYPALKDMVTDLDTGEFDIELTGFNEEELSNLWDYGEKEGLLKEVTEDIESFEMTHILLSFPIDKILEVNKILEPLVSIENIEIEQSSN